MHDTNAQSLMGYGFADQELKDFSQILCAVGGDVAEGRGPRFRV